MRAMIFAAGMGTRMQPLTDYMPKAMVPVLGKPLLQWQIERLRRAGIDRIIINLHHKAEQIIRFLRFNRNFGCDIRISDETDRLLETGGGLRKALKEYPSEEPTLAFNADILSTDILPELFSSYAGQTAFLVVSRRNTSRYFSVDRQYRLNGWVNTQTGETRPAGADLNGCELLAFSGMQIVSPDIIPYMDQMKSDRFSLVDLYMHIVEQDGCIQVYEPRNQYQMMDVGKIEQLPDVERWAENLI